MKKIFTKYILGADEGQPLELQQDGEPKLQGRAYKFTLFCVVVLISFLLEKLLQFIGIPYYWAEIFTLIFIIEIQ